MGRYVSLPTSFCGAFKISNLKRDLVQKEMKEELGRGTDPISFAWYFRYPKKLLD